MQKPARKTALGRGLAALVGDAAYAIEEGVGAQAEGAPSYKEGESPRQNLGKVPETHFVSLAKIRVNPHQPRKRFGDQELEELAASIKSCGIVQPVLVKPRDGEGFYQLVAGERRFRAAQKAGLHEIPVFVRALDDGAVLQIALIENLHREALTPVEEARAYAALMAEHGHSAAALGEALGKSRSHIANMTRLLDLPPPLLEMLDAGDLSAGHARACLSAASPVALGNEIVQRGLNVRQAELLARGGKTPRPPRAPKPEDANTLAFARALSESLGLAVILKHRRDKGGELRIRYRTLEQLEDLARRLKG